MSGSTGSKLANLPAAATLGGGELIYLVQNGLDVRSTVGALQSGGGSLPLTGGTLTGTLGLDFAKAWSGGYPNGNPGLSSIQFYTGGTPSGGVGYSGGVALPFNLLGVQQDSIVWNDPGATHGLLIQHYYGGGSTSGGRLSFSIDHQLTGAITATNPFHQAMFISSRASHNVTGAASGAGNGLGNFFGIGGYFGGFSSGIYAHVATGQEWDFVPESGSSVDYVCFAALVNAAPVAYTANLVQSYISCASLNGAGSDHVILLGGPIVPNSQFPGSGTTASGDLIYAATGSVKTAIDFSNLTLSASGWLLHGPAGAGIDGSGYSHTDRIVPIAADSLAVMAKNGTGPAAVFASGVATPSTYVILSANTAFTTIDTGGTAGQLLIGGATTTALQLGRAAITTQILGTIKGAAGSFTANGSVATALSSVGPTGSHTTVQEWFTITNASGTVRYIPAF